LNPHAPQGALGPEPGIVRVGLCRQMACSALTCADAGDLVVLGAWYRTGFSAAWGNVWGNAGSTPPRDGVHGVWLATGHAQRPTRRGTLVPSGSNRAASCRGTQRAKPWSRRSPAGCHRLASKIWTKVGSRTVCRPLPSRAGEETPFLPESSSGPSARSRAWRGLRTRPPCGVSHPRRGRGCWSPDARSCMGGPRRCPTPCPRRSTARLRNRASRFAIGRVG
jgi:hypothetical protein